MKYKQMIKDIDDIVNNDWGSDVDCLALHKEKPIPQKIAWEMQEALMRIYMIAHQITCDAHGDYGVSKKAKKESRT